MFCELDSLADGEPRTRADVIVVGSGPAGLPVVSELLASGATVVVLEAGPSRRAAPTSLTQTEQPGIALPSSVDGRKKMFGGTGQDWSGQCLPMDPIDFQRRSWIDGSGWPVDAADIAGWYPEAERYFGVEGASYDLAVHRRAGISPPAWDPDVFINRNTVYSPKLRVGDETRRSLMSAREAIVVTSATARTIVFTATRRAVSGVDAVSPTGHVVRFSAPVVVIACGAIENARLLLLSEVDGWVPGNDGDHVGRHFQEHPFASTAVVSEPAEELLATYRAIFDRGIRHRAKTALASEVQKGDELLAGTIDLDFRYADTSSVAAAKRLDNAVSRKQFGAEQWRDVGRTLRHPVPVGRMAYRRIRGQAVEGETPEKVLLRVQSEQDPAGDSAVRLSSRRDVLGLPIPRVEWQVGDREWRTTRALTRLARDQFGDLGLGRVEAFGWLESRDGYRDHVLDTYHHAGTTRMSDDASDGVVDQNCQVHGVAGLYAAGGSVFPTSGYANPTLTIVALALRLSSHLTKTRTEPTVSAGR